LRGVRQAKESKAGWNDSTDLNAERIANRLWGVGKAPRPVFFTIRSPEFAILFGETGSPGGYAATGMLY
jgi:hypothetical protein